MIGLSVRHKWVTRTAILLLATLTACSPTHTLAPTETPAPSPTPTTGLQAVNGTRLYYEIIGQGAPVFVLHGSGGSDRYFLPYMEPLSNEYQLVLYDQRGTGRSDGQIEVEAISIGQFVEDLEALRIALGFEKISVMGHSRGALIALAYALKYQAHLDHLILVGAFPVSAAFFPALGATVQQRMQHLSAEAQHDWVTTCSQPAAALSSDDIDQCTQILAQWEFFDPAKAVGVDWGLDENTIKNRERVQALMQTSFDRVRGEIDSQLSSLNVPTLIIHGDFDAIPLASSEYLHQHIVGSQIIVVSQSGHFPFIEQPEQFVAAVRTFLSQ